MKPERELYPQVYDWDNLWLAYVNAARGKRGHGPAASFEYKLADNLLQLQAELRDKTYQPGRYHSFSDSLALLEWRLQPTVGARC